ncbi:hypothetical protein EHS13_17280 [Paenibacillus psychroresistens]|uniref:Sortilin N-terminal domain-containing protein n=1 Tax=Paenibacillus psychroresistens TaxID=1778678 RepID=A0A6B8RLJ6_9BACL|nr:PepSY domain-containing protein [Paenibacillus psychroresistens]QGQ96512.1 hypothetical protein EHS13_17280 [Paenibacillus psychroresistens]
MKTTKPDWYDKLEEGPFINKKFTEVMMRQTEANVKGVSQFKRNHSSRMVWGSIIIACSLGIILSLNWDHLDLWLKTSKQSITVNNPVSTQTPKPGITFISKEEAMRIAKAMDANAELQWSAFFKENVQGEPDKPDVYSVWIVKALYPAGNNMKVTMDAITGKILSLGEGEAPSQRDLTPENTALYKDLKSFQMIDTKIGWAQTTRNILRTTDGGNTWKTQHIAEIDFQSRNVEIWAKFIDSLTAYVAAPDGSGSGLTVYITKDGGETWLSSKAINNLDLNIRASNPNITFVNKNTGWMLAHFDTAEGSESGELFKTMDSGQTWKIISWVINPLEGTKSGVTFATEQDGYLTGSSQEDGIWLFASHDGGLNWQKQTLLAPSGFSADGGAAYSYPPQFFESKKGILPVSLSKDDKKPLIFYSTHDSGQTWEPTTPLIPERSNFEAWDFIDADHGYATDGANIYVTTDGARSWTTHPLETAEFRGVHLDFVSQNDGFAIAKYNMYKTTDGGITWEFMEQTVK